MAERTVEDRLREEYFELLPDIRRVAVQLEAEIKYGLIGRFWEVEHSAIYKPTPRFKPVARSLAMKQRSKEVLQVLGAFEEQFERLRLERIQDEEAR